MMGGAGFRWCCRPRVKEKSLGQEKVGRGLLSRKRKTATKVMTSEATQALGAIVMLISDTLLCTEKRGCITSNGSCALWCCPQGRDSVCWDAMRGARQTGGPVRGVG